MAGFGKNSRFGSSGAKTPDTESPFVVGSQITDRRMGSLRRSNMILGTVCGLLVLLVVVLSISLTLAAREKQVELYVVEVDHSNRPTQIQQADGEWVPTEAMLHRTIADLVSDIRSKPSDPVVLRQQWLKSYDYLAGDAVLTMNQFAQSQTDTNLLTSVDINAVTRLSDNSIQVHWTENTVQNGITVHPQAWVGVFQYQVNTATDAEAAFKNPLGVFVNAISWSKDIRISSTQ